MSPEVVFSIAYFLFCLCVVVPPTEVRAAGLTLQNLLSSWLGSEDMQFVHYHIKRTTANVVAHAFLPLGYFVGFSLVSTDPDFLPLGWGWGAYLAASLALCLCACALGLRWRAAGWRHHPIARSLHLQGGGAGPSAGWASVAGQINVEFRRVDKFTAGPPDLRVIVTDSWVLRTRAYGLDVAHQADCHLNLLRTEEHALSPESRAGVQYLAIQVISANPHVQPFEIRLFSSDYKDLRDKLTVPVVNARNVVIQQTLTDRFLEAFRHQVQTNPPYVPAEGSPSVDNCIGCLQVPANVKLVKLCAPGQQGECVPCFCRPMWCLECMCKWFASRQDQGQPETWLGSRSPCPTCRSKFCMLDVCPIP